jgi:hypothetical protein
MAKEPDRNYRIGKQKVYPEGTLVYKDPLDLKLSSFNNTYEWLLYLLRCGLWYADDDGIVWKKDETTGKYFELPPQDIPNQPNRYFLTFTWRGDTSQMYAERMVMAARIGRPLTQKDRIVFLDGNVRNYAVDNLKLTQEPLRTVEYHIGEVDGTVAANKARRPPAKGKCGRPRTRVSNYEPPEPPEPGGNLRGDVRTRVVRQ